MLKVKQRNAWTLKIRFYIGEMFRGTSAEATLHAFPQRAGLGKRGAVGGREGGGDGSPAHMSCSTGWLVRGLPGSSLQG